MNCEHCGALRTSPERDRTYCGAPPVLPPRACGGAAGVWGVATS